MQLLEKLNENVDNENYIFTSFMRNPYELINKNKIIIELSMLDKKNNCNIRIKFNVYNDTSDEYIINYVYNRLKEDFSIDVFNK